MADYDCGFCEILKKCGAKILLSDFYTFITKLVCQIAEDVVDIAEAITTTGIVIGPTATTQATQLYGTIASGAVTANFAAIITDAHQKLDIKLANNTNALIEVSFDGVNVHETMVASSGISIPLGSYGRHEVGSIFIRGIAGSLPSDGSVYASARY